MNETSIVLASFVATCAMSAWTLVTITEPGFSLAWTVGLMAGVTVGLALTLVSLVVHFLEAIEDGLVEAIVETRPRRL